MHPSGVAKSSTSLNWLGWRRVVLTPYGTWVPVALKHVCELLYSVYFTFTENKNETNQFITNLIDHSATQRRLSSPPTAQCNWKAVRVRPRFHAHTHWAAPLQLASSAPRCTPRRASERQMTWRWKRAITAVSLYSTLTVSSTLHLYELGL